ncbi:MAG: immunoglobulin domain-containing protein [Clostridia bacterium]|nr:immunoglobulin domain-containing protein [Clostridia bacterium]
MKNRIVSFITVIMLMCSAFPIAAFAATSDPVTDDMPVWVAYEEGDEVVVENNEPYELNTTIATAYYDESGQLVSVDVKQMILEAGRNRIGLQDASSDDATDVKLFIWSAEKIMKPLSRLYETKKPKETATPEPITELTVITQPQSCVVGLNRDAVFTAEVEGGKAPYEFHWYYLNADSPSFARCEDAADRYARYNIERNGSTGKLTVKKDEDMQRDGAMYYCVITDAEGDTVRTETATLTLTAAYRLDIIGQPAYRTVRKGSDTTFNIEIYGGKPPYNFQWYYCNADSTSFTRCEDAAEWYERYSIDNVGLRSSLTVRKVGEYMQQDGAKYYCVVTDAEGSTMTSRTALLSVYEGIKIETQPKSYSAAKGTDVNFFVSVNGGKTPYTFQWYYCNAGETSFTRCEDAAEWYERYSIDNDGGNYSLLTVKEAGEYMPQNGANYYCVITDADGESVTSDVAVLAVTD